MCIYIYILIPPFPLRQMPRFDVTAPKSKIFVFPAARPKKPSPDWLEKNSPSIGGQLDGNGQNAQSRHQYDNHHREIKGGQG